MKNENIRALESLSLFCHTTGLLSVMIGIATIFMDVLNMDFTHILSGIYIFVTGYALVKISSKITKALVSEKNV